MAINRNDNNNHSDDDDDDIRWYGCRSLASDICVTVAASYLISASFTAGVTSEQTADRKYTKYDELIAVCEFQPMAVASDAGFRLWGATVSF